ncbi:hypothetical protein B0H16DRAFT_1468143 [Mycena metata]|uniref:Uncharacterized protein n=1 Tax=Mycena metata TaxID=1033252 RepID=A0AAD7I239_9AGAR|nr:hypothetical protein B0H16DRAFT_1468143 [Mycena metata]
MYGAQLLLMRKIELALILLLLWYYGPSVVASRRHVGVLEAPGFPSHDNVPLLQFAFVLWMTVSKACIHLKSLNWCGGDNSISAVANKRSRSLSPSFQSSRLWRFGGGATPSISGRILSPYIKNKNNIASWEHMNYAFEFQCTSMAATAVLARNRNCISVAYPGVKLSTLMSKYDVLRAAKAHSLWIPQRLPASECRRLFSEHKCENTANKVWFPAPPLVLHEKLLLEEKRHLD